MTAGHKASLTTLGVPKSPPWPFPVLPRPPSSAVGPYSSARQPGAPGSTVISHPDLMHSLSGHRRHTEAGTRCTARAPACHHATAELCRLAAIDTTSTGSVRQPPATHGAQPAVGLRCVRAGWAGAVSSTCFVDEACWSSMPRTTRMVSKASITWGEQRVPSVPTLQRRRGMGRWRRTDMGTLRRQAEVARDLRLHGTTQHHAVCGTRTSPARSGAAGGSPCTLTARDRAF